ncbi:hypothetical protein SLA2020_437710 [Shorea laevis]
MDPSFEIFDSSSSDDELEVILAFSVEEERCVMKEAQHHALVLFNAAACSSGVILYKDTNAFYTDYFSESPVYPPKKFRRRFRMQRSLFLRIQAAIEVSRIIFRPKKRCC